MTEFFISSLSTTLGLFIFCALVLSSSFVLWIVSHEITSTIVLIVASVLLFKVGIASWSDILTIGAWLLGYLAIGFLHSFVSWIYFVKYYASRVRKLIRHLHVEVMNAPPVDGEQPSNLFVSKLMVTWRHKSSKYLSLYNDITTTRVNPMIDSLTTTDSAIDAEAILSRKFDSNLYEVLISKLSPLVSDNGSKLIAWIIFWPCELIVNLFSRYIYSMLMYVVIRYQGIYNRITKAFFKI